MIKSKHEALETVRTLMSDCTNAIEGDWDSSMPNGELGFGAMLDALEELAQYIHKNVKVKAKVK